MTVSRIIGDKGGEVVTAQPHRTIGEVARLLAERRIGAVVVTDGNGGIKGILSERDIVRAIATGGATALDDAVSRHMTAKVVTCGPSARIPDIMASMTAGKFRHMPVEEHGRLTGIISIGDVVKHRLAEIESERLALENYITS